MPTLKNRQRVGLGDFSGVRRQQPMRQNGCSLTRLFLAGILSQLYELYHSLSTKMMDTISQFADEFYIYSIDELFARFDTTLNHDSWTALGRDIRRTVWKEVRLPVGAGGGMTPTLAKAASHAAKRLPGYNGVAVIDNEQSRVDILEQMDVTDVWGIGSRLGKKLAVMGIHNAHQLSQQSPARIRKQFSILVENTVRELNGEIRIQWDDVRPDKQQIYSTRTFGSRVTDKTELHKALVGHCESAMRKLRRQKSLTKAITVFASNSPHDDTPFYRKSVYHQFPVPTIDTRVVTNALSGIVDKVFKPGVCFYRCGVGIIDIIPAANYQSDLFNESKDNPKLMNILDAVNDRYGKSTLQLASKGSDKKHEMKRQFLTKRATTRWSDIPKIKC
jgi:DNA polymerase V|tara:strand:+ start:70 stop:1236 length:1167 start_codon:yes stop_codon:yes gene_type:complete